MPSKKKGTYQGKAKSPTLGQRKLPCNCVTNLLAPTTCCFFWRNKYPRELRLGAFSSSHSWWGRKALARVSNKFPYCKLHCFKESSFPTGDSDYGQNTGRKYTLPIADNWTKTLLSKALPTRVRLFFPLPVPPIRKLTQASSPPPRDSRQKKQKETVSQQLK